MVVWLGYDLISNHSCIIIYKCLFEKMYELIISTPIIMAISSVSSDVTFSTLGSVPFEGNNEKGKKQCDVQEKGGGNVWA